MIGRHHPALRRVRALRRDAALRQHEGVFLAEGLHLAEEALRADAPVEQAFVSPRLRQVAAGPRIESGMLERGWPVEQLADDLLDSLQDARAPQPVLLVVRRAPAQWPALLRPSPPLIVLCLGVQEPGNLGAVLRTAEAAGATGLVASGGVDPFHPRAVRASMGSIFRLPLLATALEPALSTLASHGVRGYAADPRRGEPFRAVDYRGAVALAFGGEGQGLPDPLPPPFERQVRIPLRAPVESLSVGAAAAVMLFEVARQREPG